jgi:hypothetical protein
MQGKGGVMRRIVCMFSLLLLIPVQGFSQDGLSIDNLYLKLGTPKKVVMDKFKDYTVSKVPDSYEMYVIAKHDEASDLYIPFGSVGFKKNQLSYISSRWFQGHLDINIHEFADKLYYLINKSGKDQMDINVKIKTNVFRSPDHEIKTMDFILGKRKISIFTVNGEMPKYGKQVSLFEAISSTPFK